MAVFGVTALLAALEAVPGIHEGRHAVLLSPPVSAKARTLANARLATLPDVGHLPQEEDPLASLAPLEAFPAR